MDSEEGCGLLSVSDVLLGMATPSPVCADCVLTVIDPDDSDLILIVDGIISSQSSTGRMTIGATSGAGDCILREGMERSKGSLQVLAAITEDEGLHTRRSGLGMWLYGCGKYPD